ncbi:MAG: carbon-nitrogen hydrolase family protein [Anaerolineae bacterium]
MSAGNGTWRIALAALAQPADVAAGVDKMVSALGEAAAEGAAIICFPETYVPGLRGGDIALPAPSREAMVTALSTMRAACVRYGVAAIVGMEWPTKRGLYNRAFVISDTGRLLGQQTKNQITPGGESDSYAPDGRRRVFRLGDVTFGIVICHEGWRYPETVRWAVLHGAQVVFQPQQTGSDGDRGSPMRWGESFYEKAMLCRAQENTVYFASVNRAMRSQNSATSLIDPQGGLVAYVPYRREQLLVADLDLSRATRYYALRYRPADYPA